MSETDPEPGPESYGTPRWVKVFGMIALVVIALLLVVWLIRGTGSHGPARHMSTGGATTKTAASASLQLEFPGASPAATRGPGATS